MSTDTYTYDNKNDPIELMYRLKTSLEWILSSEMVWRDQIVDLNYKLTDFHVFMRFLLNF